MEKLSIFRILDDVCHEISNQILSFLYRILAKTSENCFSCWEVRLRIHYIVNADQKMQESEKLAEELKGNFYPEDRTKTIQKVMSTRKLFREKGIDREVDRAIRDDVISQL